MSDSLQLHGIYSPLNSSGQNIWVDTLSFSSGSSKQRNHTKVIHMAGTFFTSWATREAPFRTNRKTWILPTRSVNKLHTQDVSPQYLSIFQTALLTQDVSYKENLMEQTYRCLFTYPVTGAGGLPYSHTVRGNCYWKLTSKQEFSSSVWLSPHMTLRKLCSLKKGKVSTESVLSGLYLSTTVWILRCESSRIAQRT